MTAKNTFSTDLFGHLNPNARWHGEPTTRGTWTILSTCLVTFSLCVWSAVHVNCEPGDEFKGDRKKPKGWARVLHALGLCFTFFASRATWRKICWVILGLLLPDMVLIIAFAQRLDADRLTKEGHQVRPDQKTEGFWLDFVDKLSCGRSRRNSDREKRKTAEQILEEMHKAPPWTLVTSFYAMMGGFAFDISKAERPFLPGTRRGLCITYEGIRYLLNHRKAIIPYIHEKDIEDKSKNNALAKLLVCVQAVWFLVQCINRLAGHLTLSLLELSTFCHVICTLCTYVCWWRKPLNIERPTSIDSPEAYPTLALMTLSSGVGLVDTGARVYVNFAALLPDVDLKDSKSKPESVTIEQEHVDVFVSSHNMSKLFAQRSIRSDEQGVGDAERGEAIGFDPLLLRYAAEEILDNGWLLGTHVVDDDLMRDITKFTPMPLVDDRIESLESLKYSNIRGRQKAKWQDAVALPILFTGPIYGAIHLLAWDGSFRTTAEQVLWRICAIGMAAPFVLVVLYVMAYIGPPCSQKLTRRITDVVVEYGIMVYAPLYLFGRVYILVECFLQLPYLPDTAFQVPVWTQYWIHLS